MANYGFKGWIKLWRTEMKSILYHSEPFDKWHAYIDLCLLADETGTVKTSLKALKTRWSWSHTRKVVDFLGSDLVSDSVSVTRIPNKGTVIRIKSSVAEKYKDKKSSKNQDFGSVSGSVSGFEESFKEDERVTEARSSSPLNTLEEYRRMNEELDDE